MDKRAVEESMSVADRAIIDIFNLDENKRKLPFDSKIKSKMSAFGATVVMSGLLPAVAYYEKNEETVVSLLWYMYKDKHNDCKDDSLYKVIINNSSDSNKLYDITEEIINYSVALKLVLNLYIPKEEGAK